MEIDEDWLKFVQGDNTALSSVYRREYSGMLFAAYRFLQDQEKAKDVVSDIFRKLLEFSFEERRQKLSGVNEKLSVFLRVLVKNKCLDQLKIEKNRKSHLTGIFYSSSRSTKNEDLVEADFLLMIETLPFQQQRVLKLHLQGYKNDEVAARLNISVNTSRNTLHIAKSKVREIWDIFMA